MSDAPLLLSAAATAAAAAFTVLQAGPARLLTATTLIRLLPLAVANDLLLAHAHIGPAVLPALDAATTTALTGALISLHLILRRVTRF